MPQGRVKFFFLAVPTLCTPIFGNASTLTPKKLRCERAYIHATHVSRVDVAAHKVLNAFARKYSDIRYYERPAFLGEHGSENGAVLDMTALSPFCNPRTPMFAYSEKWHRDFRR